MSIGAAYCFAMAAVEALGAIHFSIERERGFALSCVLLCGVMLFAGLRAL